MKQGVIMAAGLGKRLSEITKTTPKSLIRVNDQPLLERNIEFMIEAGFDRIVLIVGYKKEKFYYLKDKYPLLEIVENTMFDSSNTISSIYFASKYFDCETYITTADNYLSSNPYTKYVGDTNFYILRPFEKFEKAEWTAVLNEENRFMSVNLCSYEGNSYTGMSHWTYETLQIIKDKLNKVDWNEPSQRNRYWDELLLKDFDSIDVYAKIIDSNSEVYEFDDMGDIKHFEQINHVKITYES